MCPGFWELSAVQISHIVSIRHQVAKISAPATGLFGLFGPKVAKRVRNEFPGPLGPGDPKSPNQSRKEANL